MVHCGWSRARCEAFVASSQSVALGVSNVGLVATSGPVMFLDGVRVVLDGAVLDGDRERGLAVEAAREDSLEETHEGGLDPVALTSVLLGGGRVHAVRLPFRRIAVKSSSGAVAWRAFVIALV